MSSEWLEDGLNVKGARDRRLAPRIAEQTGLSYAVVRGRLTRVHGRTLVTNLFPELRAAVARKGTTARKPAAKSSRIVAPRPVPEPTASRAKAARTIHRVRQEFDTSCGVAVVAMFARVSHGEAMAAMFPRIRNPKPSGSYLTWLKDVLRGLDHFGVEHAGRWRRFTGWAAIRSTSLVKVKIQEGRRTWYHWVVPVCGRTFDGGLTPGARSRRAPSDAGAGRRYPRPGAC